MTPITRKTTLEALGAIVCQALLDHGIEAFLSGGAVVSIYTDNKYESFDLDFVAFGDRKKIRTIMESLGFSQERSRLFIHPHNPYMVEFPGTSLSIGDEPIQEFEERSFKGRTLKLLTPTDCIKDRLAAYIHWNDKQALEQAVLVGRDQKHNLSKVRKFCENEGNPKAYRDFLNGLK